MGEPSWNPRYVNYARAHGRTPEAQLEHDGSPMKFVFWNRDRLKESPVEFKTCGGLTDHEGYDAWLTAWVDEHPLCIEVFPMAGDSLAEDVAEYYDVLVRPDGGNPIEEHECLTREGAEEVCTKMEAKYPGGTADWLPL